MVRPDRSIPGTRPELTSALNRPVPGARAGRGGIGWRGVRPQEQAETWRHPPGGHQRPPTAAPDRRDGPVDRVHLPDPARGDDSGRTSVRGHVDGVPGPGDRVRHGRGIQRRRDGPVPRGLGTRRPAPRGPPHRAVRGGRGLRAGRPDLAPVRLRRDQAAPGDGPGRPEHLPRGGFVPPERGHRPARADQREQIAMLKAFGHTHLQVGWHYFKLVGRSSSSGSGSGPWSGPGWGPG